MRQQFARLAALAVVALTLAGCANIPRTGDVREGAAATSVVTNDVQFLPASPAPDATPEEIIRGFIDAATSPADDWGIARKYLSSAFARTWQPTAGVTIDRGNRLVRQHADKTLEMTVTALGSVDARGSYVATAEHAQSLSFALVNEGGQWRIASAPQGIVLDFTLFPQVFSASELYFYDAGFTRFVPDTRWFPARTSVSTRIVKALLDGPAEWLGSSHTVVSAFGPTSTLVADSVPIDGSTAIVNLDAKTTSSSEVVLQRMLAQLSASLSGVSRVTRVRMLLSGSGQYETSVASSSALLGSTALSQPTVVMHGQFGTLSPKGIASIAKLSPTVVSLEPSAISMAAGAQLVAAQNTNGVSLVSPSGLTRLVDNRAALAAPTVDAYGYAWTVPSTAPTAVRASSLGLVSQRVSVPWTDATELRSLSVSPEGTRVLAAYQVGNRSEVCVAVIVRSDKNVPTGVGPCLHPYTDATSFTLAAWVDASRIGLVTPTGKTSTIRLIQLGGLTEVSQAPGEVITLTGSGESLVARAATREGDVLQQGTTNRWYLIATGISALATVQ